MFDTLTRMGASGASDEWSIERSLRIDDGSNSYLSWTPSSTGNQKVWTWSGWIKRGSIGKHCAILTCDMHSGEHNNGIIELAFSNTDNLYTYFDTSGSNPYGAVSSETFRDVSGWYHIVWKVDAANTEQQIWVNGNEISTASGNNPPDYSYAINKASHIMTMGAAAWEGVTANSDMYLAEVHYCDGQEYQASDFGETDATTGQWVPKEVDGINYGTNGCYLKFSDNSNTTAATLGKDYSGNGNNWTPNNFSVSAGVGNDSFEDTPQNNWCTLNLNDKGDVTVSNGNLVTNVGSGFKNVRSTFWVNTGKWYWEVVCDDAGEGFVGISGQHELTNNRGAMYDDDSFNIRTANGNKYLGDGNDSSYGSAISDGHVVMVALDCDAGKAWIGSQGTWFNSGDPAAGTNPGKTGISDVVTPSVSLYDNEDYTMNFGANMDFAHTPPTGFKKLNASNIADPTIVKSSDYFKTVLYTGNGASSNAITGVGHQPDLVWIKARSAAYNHRIYDDIRGVNAAFLADTNAAEDQYSGYGQFKSFDSDGFTVGNGTSEGHGTNTNGVTHVAWSWKESATAGFDIVSYTGNGSSGRQVSHNLGVTPQVMMVKKRNGDEDWIVYCGDLVGTSGGWMKLNENGTPNGHSSGFNGDEPTSSVFTLGSHSRTNEDGATYINYLFSSVKGFSKIELYQGNGNTGADGVFIGTEFRPSLVIVKCIGADEHWNIPVFSTSGGHTNGIVKTVSPNLSTAERDMDNNPAVDLYANGFKVRTSDNNYNNSGEYFLFMAFAESPFKYSNAR